jgi:hypothetical protein
VCGVYVCVCGVCVCVCGVYVCVWCVCVCVVCVCVCGVYVCVWCVYVYVFYEDHQWNLHANLKVVVMLTELQGGYKKFCCCLCEWYSRARDRHYHVRAMATPTRAGSRGEERSISSFSRQDEKVFIS